MQWSAYVSLLTYLLTIHTDVGLSTIPEWPEKPGIVLELTPAILCPGLSRICTRIMLLSTGIAHNFSLRYATTLVLC